MGLIFNCIYSTSMAVVTFYISIETRLTGLHIYLVFQFPSLYFMVSNIRCIRFLFSEIIYIINCLVYNYLFYYFLITRDLQCFWWKFLPRTRRFPDERPRSKPYLIQANCDPDAIVSAGLFPSSGRKRWREKKSMSYRYPEKERGLVMPCNCWIIISLRRWWCGLPYSQIAPGW